MPIRITALFRYPIKSCAPTPLTEATLDAFGFRHDRGWMVVGARTGFFMTQREYPRMALIAPTVADEVAGGALHLAAPDMPTLSVARADAESRARRIVTVWRFTGPAEDCGEDAAGWLSTFLHEDCRLVQTPPDWGRVVNPANTATRPPEPIRFVDGYPILLTSEASLADLNTRLDVPVPMSRFRPNVVIEGAPAWAEDDWRAVGVPATGVRLRIAKPSERCAMTTVDQRTGEKTGAEPLRTLSDFRRDEAGKVLFGVNLIADAGQSGSEPLVLRVGDGIVPDI